MPRGPSRRLFCSGVVPTPFPRKTHPQTLWIQQKSSNPPQAFSGACLAPVWPALWEEQRTIGPTPPATPPAVPEIIPVSLIFPFAVSPLFPNFTIQSDRHPVPEKVAVVEDLASDDDQLAWPNRGGSTPDETRLANGRPRRASRPTPSSPCESAHADRAKTRGRKRSPFFGSAADHLSSTLLRAWT